MQAILLTWREAVASLGRERRRLLPMALGIVWGIASVMVLLAVAGGFERSQRHSLAAYGERFLLVRLNRAELDRAARGRERRLMMDPYDVERLRQGAPAIRRLSPMNSAYRARVSGRSGAGTNVWVIGALPEITQIRNLPLASGRFFDEEDEAHRRRVIVLGPLAQRQLFGATDPIGQKVRVAGFSTSIVPQRMAAETAQAVTRRGATPPSTVPATARAVRPAPGNSGSGAVLGEVGIAGELFEVIGVLRDVEVQRESYVSIARNAFVPFSTSTAVFRRYYNTIYIEPRSTADRDLALRQFAEVMGARYGFEPDDRNAVIVYFDSISRAQAIETVFAGVRLFLTAVGVLILTIGAIGIMNVVLVTLAARRYEIGLRKALGATPALIYLQLFLETALSCLVSGSLGVLLGAGGIALLQILPLPEGFSRPTLDGATAALTFVLLISTAAVAGLYPAYRAASLPPVEALRARG